MRKRVGGGDCWVRDNMQGKFELVFYKLFFSMQKDFQKQLIKGRIAELVFQQMISEAGKYTILPLGYERVLPGLLDYSHNEILKPIRTAPDFVLIPKDENDENIMIVEVKYRKNGENGNRIKEVAIEQNKRWNPSYLFIATHKAFYFERCDRMIKNGTLSQLDYNLVPEKIQKKYLELLNGFLDNV
jgi:Holliday junction resolvase-like predicted endonuclease